MASMRGWGEDSIYFDHSGECRDPETHRHCPGRWRGVVSLKPTVYRHQIRPVITTGAEAMDKIFANER